MRDGISLVLCTDSYYFPLLHWMYSFFENKISRETPDLGETMNNERYFVETRSNSAIHVISQYQRAKQGECFRLSTVVRLENCTMIGLDSSCECLTA